MTVCMYMYMLRCSTCIYMYIHVYTCNHIELYTTCTCTLVNDLYILCKYIHCQGKGQESILHVHVVYACIYTYNHIELYTTCTCTLVNDLLCKYIHPLPRERTRASSLIPGNDYRAYGRIVESWPVSPFNSCHISRIDLITIHSGSQPARN